MKRKEGVKKFGGWHTGRRDNTRQKIWDAMKVSSRFDKHQLALLVLESDSSGHMRSIGEYLTALNRAGYIRILKHSNGQGCGGNATRYLLFRDTGPLAPRYSKRHRNVYDPNTGETIPCDANRGKEALCQAAIG